MNESDQSGKLAIRERKAARLWQMAPWVALFGVTLGPPALFRVAYLLTGAATVYLVLALTSIPFALIAAIMITVVLLFFRRRWARQLRDHLASDGITADEVGYFLSELTSGEKRALKEMEKKQPLLADAYRETLALRLSASSNNCVKTQHENSGGNLPRESRTRSAWIVCRARPISQK